MVILDTCERGGVYIFYTPSSARVALQLKRKGIKRVFPLVGGMEAWMSAGFDVQNESFEMARKPA